jgi:hypothetical protein
MTRPILRPAPTDHAPFHAAYVRLVPDGDVLGVLEKQAKETVAFLKGLSEEKSRFRYAKEKWSIREVVGHMNDAERVFTYRALSFARGDTSSLPGFDENGWAATSNADQRTLAEHIAEYSAVRAATLALYRGFSDNEIHREGVASGHRVTVAAIAYVVAGHERHHVGILKDRYLSP